MLLQQVLRKLSKVPYENISKVVAFDRYGDASRAMALRGENMAEADTGGTCFALTYRLKKELMALGIESEYIMGDKYHLSNIHCGLRVCLEEACYLLDPGYMIFEPLPLPQEGMEIFFDLIPNAVWLQDISQEAVWRLCTGIGTDKKMRFDFRKAAVTEELFMRYWRETYFFEMMGYPVLNKLHNGTQYYLQKNSWIQRTREGSVMEKISRDRFKELAVSVYGLSDSLVNTYLEVLDKTSKKNPFKEAHSL